MVVGEWLARKLGGMRTRAACVSGRKERMTPGPAGHVNCRIITQRVGAYVWRAHLWHDLSSSWMARNNLRLNNVC